MAEVVIGNETKQISNNLHVSSQVRAVDPDHWYMELFGRFPTYKYYMDINRIDEDEDFDIYNKVYNDILNTGDFTVLCYEYNNMKNVSNEPLLPGIINESANPKSKYEVYVSKFIFVSNTEPLMIIYEYDSITVMTHIGVDKINEVVEKYLSHYNQDDDRVKCYIVVKDPDIYLNDFNVEIKNDLDFDLYNEGFEEIHNSIVKSIKEDKNGLYLFYGKPGTGKSTYIRHLIQQCGNEKRKFVYVPSRLFQDFTDPAIIPFLLRHRGCVFIIEDCENLVTVDDGIRSDGITDLLNMTDGLLADALSIKIICTFNTDYHKIDDALLRPGRCRCKYEFDLLDKDRANKVAEKLNLQKVDKDISLAELFNPEIDFADGRKKKIGFN